MVKLHFIKRYQTICRDVWKDNPHARCFNCGKIFNFDDTTPDVYRGRYVCPDCFDCDFGYCNGCDCLHRYDDMILTKYHGYYCKSCVKE